MTRRPVYDSILICYNTAYAFQTHENDRQWRISFRGGSHRYFLRRGRRIRMVLANRLVPPIRYIGRRLSFQQYRRRVCLQSRSQPDRTRCCHCLLHPDQQRGCSLRCAFVAIPYFRRSHARIWSQTHQRLSSHPLGHNQEATQPLISSVIIVSKCPDSSAG